MNPIGNLILVRSWPGAGKTTFAIENYVKPFGYILMESDMYFIRNGEYKWNRDELKQAHNWCFTQTASLLKQGENVIVANTFIKKFEIERYLRLNPSKIYRLTGNFENRHNVPIETIQRMKSNIEDIDGEIFV